MGYLLGIDLGSSSVKVALVDAASGCCVASAHSPETEAPIKALQPGWAEQRPDDWWQYFKTALGNVLSATGHPLAADSIDAIGISYQMHGLVCLDKDLRPLRDAIIWCDSRGVPYGERAFRELGEAWCTAHLHNSPTNFTASKLAWVRENEPELFGRIRHIMLPGDYLALRLSGTPATTACGLSEMMLWDYSGQCPVDDSRMAYATALLPSLVPTFGLQGTLAEHAASELGLRAGIPITYRAGDQPNNALSLHVLRPGEVAATAGTSGVVYGIADNPVESQRVNTFLHVNHTLGLMHCVNGCGILNSWLRHQVAAGMGYDEMNRLAAGVPAGSDGLTVIPFGNGAERVLLNREPGSSIHGLNFNLHGQAHLLRAAQEGIAFSLMYGMEQMGRPGIIRAGRANMFLSPLFRQTLADVSGATIELYATDGAVGVARGAGLGAGIYKNSDEAFASLERLALVEPLANPAVNDAYIRWKEILTKEL